MSPTNIRGNQLVLPNREDPSDPRNLAAIEIWANTQVVNQVTGSGVTSQPLAVGPGAQGTGLVTISAAGGATDFKLLEHHNGGFGTSLTLGAPTSDVTKWREIWIRGDIIATTGASDLTSQFTFTTPTTPDHMQTIWDYDNITGGVATLNFASGAGSKIFSSQSAWITFQGHVNPNFDLPSPFDLLIHSDPNGPYMTGMLRAYNLANALATEKQAVRDAFGVFDSWTAVTISGTPAASLSGDIVMYGLGAI